MTPTKDAQSVVTADRGATYFEVTMNHAVENAIDLTGTFTADLHSLLRDAVEQGPLASDVSTGATVVLRQRDVEALAHDQRLEGTGLALFDMMGITDGCLRDWYGQIMFTTEGDYHRRIRSLVSKAFTPRSVEALRAPAADMAAKAVASTSQGGDLVDACSTLATRLMCRLLGVPDSDVPVFSRWLDALSPVFLMMTPEQIAAATTAITELQSYVDELTTRRSKAPGRDLITALLAAEADGERLTHDETVAMIANLLVAGHDTAGSQIPCSILVALQHRDELTGVHEDQARLASAVAETMRLEPSIPFVPRTAVEPIEFVRQYDSGWQRSSSASPPRAAMRRHGANPIISTQTAFRGLTRPDCSTSVLARTTAWATPWPRLQSKRACALYLQRIIPQCV